MSNTTRQTETLQWKVDTHGLFTEILDNPQCSTLKIPLNILLAILRKVAQRSSELNDPQMNRLMIRLGLYSIANPSDPEYDWKLCSEILEGESVT
jgi:hypothetical protein